MMTIISAVDHARSLRRRADLIEREALPIIEDGQRALAGAMFLEAARLRARARRVEQNQTELPFPGAQPGAQVSKY